jgi:hypothetical protein
MSKRLYFALSTQATKAIEASETLMLQISTKVAGNLLAFVDGNKEPFWFQLQRSCAR